MKSNHIPLPKLLIIIPFILLITSCTAGDSQFTVENPAGFWYGLWHGIIAVISLIIHVFNDSVTVYEISNTGGWYDLGFLMGVIFIWGGSSQATCRTSADKKRDREWDEIGDKVRKELKHELKKWVDDEDNSESQKEWEEIGEKVEKKLKRIIREWADKE